MNLPILVAVSQRVDLVPERGERRDALDQRMCTWLLAAGGFPVPVPNRIGTTANAMQGLEIWLSSVRPDAIILSGGNDIGEIIERDQTEKYLLSYAQKNLLPVLGICRGMQMMAVWAGGTLSRINGHVRTRHRLQFSPGVDDLPLEVNSFHDWGLNDCPHGFEVIARAPDNAIEAIRHINLPWEGWMWHPERQVKPHDSEMLRLRHLFGLERKMK